MSASGKPAVIPAEEPARAPLRDTELPTLAAGFVGVETQRGRKFALSVVVLITFLTVAWIASPIWVGLALGTAMAFTAQQSYRSLTRKLGNRRALAAALVTLIGGILAGVAGAIAIYTVTQELITLVGILQKKMDANSLAGLIGDRGARMVDHLGLDRADLMERIRHELTKATAYFTGAVAVILQATGSAVLGLIIALMTMYYVLLEWPTISIRLERVLPLDPRHTRALMLEFRDVGRSSFTGTVATAIVQGVLAGVGYMIAGVPNFVTLGMLTAVASFLPLAGTGLIWGPVTIYLFMSGAILPGVFLLAWGLLVVMALADYVIRPRLVGGKDHGPPLLMLIALIGGVELFGLVGLLVAPILMSLFLAALRIYEREVDAEAQVTVTAATPSPPEV